MTQPSSAPPPRLPLDRHAFFFDFDGTLTPIVDRPEDVALPDRMRDLLTALDRATAGAVAIVTGRALSDITGHLPGLDLPLSGSHGHETRLPGAETLPEPAGADVLDAPEKRLALFADRHELNMERKPGALTLHYRAAPHLAHEVKAAVDYEVGCDPALKALHGNMVSEVALASAGKGRAIKAFLDSDPFRGRLPVMVGDDVTDEDGFTAAQEAGGFGVKVGDAASTARYRVRSVEALADWIEELLAAGA